MPRAKKPSAFATAEQLLASAAKPAERGPGSGYVFDRPLHEAGVLLVKMKQKQQLEKEIEVLEEAVLAQVDPWYRDRAARDSYDPTVRVPAEAGVLRVTYMHRYAKLRAEQEPKLREFVGPRFERWFAPELALHVRKEIARDPEQIRDLVEALGEMLGDRFATVFEAERTLLPTRPFTEERWGELDPGVNTLLEDAGVKQVVTVGPAK